MSEKNVLYLALGAVAALTTLVLGAYRDWDLVTLLAGALLAAGIVGLYLYLRPRPQPEPQVVRSPAPQAATVRTSVGPVSLETASPEFRVEFSATVLWQPIQRAEQPRLASTRPKSPTTDPGAPAPAGEPPATPASPAPATTTGPEGGGSTAASAQPEPAQSSGAGVDDEAVDDEPTTTPPSVASSAAEKEQEAADVAAPGLHSAGQRRVGRDDTRPGWHAELAAYATAATVAHVEDLVRRSAFVDRGRTAQRLAEGMVQPQADPTETVWWCAQDVRLEAADPDDDTRIRTASRLRKQVGEWEQQRDLEKTVRTYLGGDALKTNGTALVWWLARHLDRDDKAVESAHQLIEQLARVSAVSQDRSDPGRNGSSPSASPLAPPSPHGAVHPDDNVVLHDLVTRKYPDSDQRAMFARKLADLVENSDRPNDAKRIRTLFDLPDLHGETPESPE